MAYGLNLYQVCISQSVQVSQPRINYILRPHVVHRETTHVVTSETTCVK